MGFEQYLRLGEPTLMALPNKMVRNREASLPPKDHDFFMKTLYF